MLATVWYGGVQIVLGIIIAIPCMTLGALTTTIALCLSLLLTGIYSILGSGYIRSAHHLLTLNPSRLSPSPPLTLDRLITIHIQFLKVYTVANIILVCLGLGTFIEGTILYMTSSPTLGDQGSTPAIGGIAALVINIFICGCAVADMKRLIQHGYEEHRPRSPTPNAGIVESLQVDVSTITSVPGAPPHYSQIDRDQKDDDVDGGVEMPPSYDESLTGSTVDLLGNGSGMMVLPVGAVVVNIGQRLDEGTSFSLPRYDDSNMQNNLLNVGDLQSHIDVASPSSTVANNHHNVTTNIPIPDFVHYV